MSRTISTSAVISGTVSVFAGVFARITILRKQVEARLGVVGGIAIPEVNRITNAFIAGAKEINPDVEAKVSFINEWFNPATPTVAQREDALMKRRSQGVLSRRGYMVELGYSEARIEQELQWLADEATDPILAQVMRDVSDDPALSA